jgi:hypothetical membrane protein
MNMTTTARSTVWQYGALGLFGIGVFLSSLIVIHLTSPGIDWLDEYVSNLANTPSGWIFITGTFVHGLGNLALATGLRKALQPAELRNWAVVLFGLAAVGILLTGIFPMDPQGQELTITGRLHRTFASVAFMIELAALFVFSIVFRHDPGWQRQHKTSVLLAVTAAVVLMAFIIALQIGLAAGLAERAALAVFLSWEIWACIQLIRWRI